MERAMKKEVAISIVLTFLLFTYANVNPDEVAFEETYKSLDPLVDESVENHDLFLLGLIWKIIPFFVFLGGTLILLIACYVIIQHALAFLDLNV
jgi:hypothetical protein